MEYYGGTRTLVVAHDGGEASSGVGRVSYCSRELFDTLTGDVLKPAATNSPVSAAVEFSNPNDKPTILQYNPGACQDLYHWAQREYETVRRGGDAARRQAILDVMVTSQKGDCASARSLADASKKMR